jgi:vitamin B12 transporter
MNKIIKMSIVASLVVTSIQAIKLEDIVVSSATKSEQSIKDITSSIEIISSYELEEKHITTVVEALNLISGINYSSNGGIGATSFLNLRGSSNNRTLILIDGIKYKDHSNITGTDIAHIMVTDIERIEVIKGAQSGIWGADASAGVINIITKEAKENTNGSILFEAGSFNSKKYGAIVSHKTDNFDIKLNAQKFTSDGFTTQAPKDEDISQYEDDGYKNTTINVKAGFNITNDAKINISATSIDAQKEYDSFNNPDDEIMKNDTQTKTYQVSYSQKLNNHDIKLKLESSKIKKDQIGTTFGVKQTNSTSTNVELNDKFNYNQNSFLVAGIGINTDKMDYTNADTSTNSAKNDSSYLYATNSNKFDKLVLTQSLRYDNHDNFNAKTTGKLGTKYNLLDEFNIFANVGTSYSVPQLVQNINPWGDTNMSIKPEESKSYDIGFTYKSLNVTYFYQEVTDLIQWFDPTPTDWTNSDAIYKNLDGQSTFKGLELSYKNNLGEDIFFNLNYTRLSAKDKNDQNLARRPEQTIKFGIDYYGISKTHIGLNGEYIGQRYDLANNQGEQTGKYTIANAVVNYEISNSLSIYTKIKNITDKYYQTVDGFATSPRAYYAGIKYEF